MMRRLLSIFVLLLSYSSSSAQTPKAPKEYQRYFSHYSDQRSLPERLSHALGFEHEPIGRSHAIIAGVSNYPKIPDRLEPAESDLRKLESWLKSSGHFDEIVVLHNADFNEDNLNFFLRSYFPSRLSHFPKSRFLFAFSGHGIQVKDSPYLLTVDSHSFIDSIRSVDMKELRVKLDKSINAAYQSLVLLNSCYSGAFAKDRSFGDSTFLPLGPGAHVITAGGANEKVYSDSSIGSGSFFFETFLAGLAGRADSLPTSFEGKNGDGVVTINELAAYLAHEIRSRYGNRVNPVVRDLNSGSRGGFFFFTPTAAPERLKRSRTLDEGIPFGTQTRFELVAQNRIRDRVLNCEWILYGNGSYLSWKEASKWSAERSLRLPSAEDLAALATQDSRKIRPITQLLDLFGSKRTPEAFWTSKQKGYYREALRLVPGPPELKQRNPEDTCGVLAQVFPSPKNHTN